MSLVEIVHTACGTQMFEIAKRIEGELKAECPVRSGEARRSIHIEKLGDYKYRIGGANLHLYYADQGNGGSSEIITSTRKYDRNGVPPGKLKFSDGSFHPYARGYDGKHFVKEVANRHR